MKNRYLQGDGFTDGSDQLFYEALLTLKNKEEVARFLKDLCTPTELQAMIDRLRVATPVKEGIPYRTIHEQTGVSVTTIGRVARCLTLGVGGYNLVLDRLKKKKEK